MKRRLLLIAVFTTLLVAGLASNRTITERYAKWMAGDFHEHTTFTDGRHPIRGVVRNGFRYGLDWVANSEHGGAFPRDAEGSFWDDTEVYPGLPSKGDPNEKGGRKTMWRWQSLSEFVYPIIQELRGEFPERLVASGLEWNVPGHEHCSVGVVAADASGLAEFEYRFDEGDNDTSGGPDGEWTGKIMENDHEKAVKAVEWMRDRYPLSSWIVFAHPERAASYAVADFRDFNDAAPDVAFGFEGLPGHQKQEQRGGYKERAVGGGTYGGAGIYIAEVGGLWDALLGEGRRWWTFVSSDFHSPSGDFWPGEYAKTWTLVRDADRDGEYTLYDVAEGLRSGNSYCVHGDLIDRLEFHVTSGARSATMGQTLEVNSGQPLTVTLRFRSPETNYNGDQPRVRFVQLIAGEVREHTPKFLADGVTPNPEYSKDTNETTRVVATFGENQIQYLGAGWYETPAYELSRLEKNTYFRLRGTNLPPDTPLETDAEGNPLPDSAALEREDFDPVEAAWQDLWFYANPIFVKLSQN